MVLCETREGATRREGREKEKRSLCTRKLLVSPVRI
jgi:hypothetical protein